MAKITDHPSHSAELGKLNRAIGQLEGIKKMIEEQRYCIEILQQLKAARAAIRNIEQSVVSRHMHQCLLQAAHNHNEQEILSKIQELQQLLKNHA